MSSIECRSLRRCAPPACRALIAFGDSKAAIAAEQIATILDV
ncbi:hypothetical protein ACFO5K_24915 [Nocardia halotolerans]|uniref:Uncharacterized protein n=1 Tax=Nocardia halotolerans TaxID=1755878 RepID=A0ABV8VRQ7_9NOCA